MKAREAEDFGSHQTAMVPDSRSFVKRAFPLGVIEPPRGHHHPRLEPGLQGDGNITR